jgi:hypothetical protein
MKSAVTNILAALIGAIVVFLLMKQCGPKNSVDVKYLPGDSVPYTVYKDKPVPKIVTYRDTITDTITDTVIVDGDTVVIIEPVDTTKILAEYYAKVEYNDTVKNDSSALIVIKEILYKNRIQDRLVRFQNRRATAIVEQRTQALVAGVTAWQTGYDVSLGMRFKRNILSLSRSNQGWGVRYQREIGWKSILEK